MVYHNQPQEPGSPPTGGQIDRFSRTGRAKPADAAAAPSKPAGGFLKAVGTVLKGAGKPALLAALGLLMVWCLGRAMEAIHGNAIFDMTLTYWLGLAVFILLALWAVGSGTAALAEIGKARDRRLAAICWVFFAVLVAAVVITSEGYRVFSSGLFATAAGSADDARIATFLLFKFHPLNPTIALNLGASSIAGIEWGIDSLAPYVWSWNALFAFFIWSIAYGIVLLIQRDKRGPKVVHLFFAAFGLLGLIVLKSLFEPETEQLILIQAAGAILLLFQILLAYATLRAVAQGPREEAMAHDPFKSYSTQKEQKEENRFIGLPPSAVTLALALVLVVPVVKDLQHQFAISQSTNRIVQQINRNQPGAAPTLVAVTAVSVRSGPAAGDRVLGILPKGTSVQALERQSDWVNIGENKWVQEKFLAPK